MPYRIIRIISILACIGACSPPPETIEQAALLVVLGQTDHHYDPEPTMRASWPVPDAPIDIVEVAVEATAKDTEWECWMWSPPVLGPRAIGVTTVAAMTAPVGFTESVIVDVSVSLRQRPDRLITCEASLPSLFHGLRAWTEGER